MFTRLHAGASWVGAKFEAGYKAFTSNTADVLAHTSLEGLMTSQAAFVFIFNNMSRLMNLISSHESESDNMRNLYISLAPAIIITLWTGYGAYHCHQATDEGNSPEIVTAFATGKIVMPPSSSNILTTKQILKCLAERVGHTLGGAGMVEELLSITIDILKKFKIEYDPGLAVPLVMGTLFFLWGVKASNAEVRNAKEGWCRLHYYGLFLKEQRESTEEDDVYHELESQESPDDSLKTFSMN